MNWLRRLRLSSDNDSARDCSEFRSIFSRSRTLFKSLFSRFASSSVGGPCTGGLLAGCSPVAGLVVLDFLRNDGMRLKASVAEVQLKRFAFFVDGEAGLLGGGGD